MTDENFTWERPSTALSLMTSPAIIACSGGGFLVMIDGKLVARTTLREMQRVLQPPPAWRKQALIALTVSALLVLAVVFTVYFFGTRPAASKQAAIIVKPVPLKIYDVVPAPRTRPQE